MYLVFRKLANPKPGDANNRISSHHGVDDRFFRGLNRCPKEIRQAVVRVHVDAGEATLVDPAGVGCRKRDEDISGAVSTDRTQSPQRQRWPFRHLTGFTGNFGPLKLRPPHLRDQLQEGAQRHLRHVQIVSGRNTFDLNVVHS